MKRGALFELSFTLGWIFGGGDMDLLPNVRQLALHFGRAFQILDDIDDIEKDRLSGKTVNYALQFGVNRAIKAIDAHLSVNGSSNSSEAALELNQAPFLSMILKSAAISKIEPAREMPSPKRMSNSATLNGDINKIMSTTDNNNHASSSTENNSNSYETRMKSLEDQISNLSLAFTRYMKEPIRESYGNSDNQRSNDESETENEQGDDESIDPVDVPTDYQLSESLLANYKHLINNQGLLVEEKCILKKNEIADVNKIFCFPSNFQVNVAPFGTPEGISASSNLKNNDTDLYIVEKIINDILKPILLLSSMISSDKTDQRQTLRNQPSQVVITLLEVVVRITSPIVGVMADPTTSMDPKVMLHQVAAIPSLETVPIIVFRRTRSKLTSRWTSRPLQTSLERIGSSKLLSRSSKRIKGSTTFKLQTDAEPNSDFNSRGSEIRLHHKRSTRFIKRQCNRTGTSKPSLPTRFLLQRVYGSKSWNEFTSSSTRSKEVKPFYQKSIIQDGRSKESVFNGKTRLLHGKTRYQESLSPCFSRRKLSRFIPIRLERSSLQMENNAIRVIVSSSNIYNVNETSTPNAKRYQHFRNRLLRRSSNRWFNQGRMFKQPQQNNESVSQTRIQVKSRKECSRANSINNVSRITNRFNINEVTCSKRKEEEYHQRYQELSKTRNLYSKKVSWFKRKTDCIERCSNTIPLVHSSNKQVSLSKSETSKWKLGSIISNFSRCQERNFKLVNSLKPMEWKRNKSVSKLRLCSNNRCIRIRCRCNFKERQQTHQNLVVPVVRNPIKHDIEPSRNARSTNGISNSMSEVEQL
ncbi:hypothetical protein RB653_004918 [Dictyostelium firmibasis]|uniref:Uncharacterized protein n=1 Tax=Dictyostelium firmibasis TaxID=79012 RepID=A0AAN7YYT1_9MYCE